MFADPGEAFGFLMLTKTLHLAHYSPPLHICASTSIYYVESVILFQTSCFLQVSASQHKKHLLCQ